MRRASARVTGRIAAGLAADFLLVDLDVPELTPSWDLSWELVRLANRDQIEAVFVGGALRLWQGWPVDWDARALMREVAARRAPRCRARADPARASARRSAPGRAAAWGFRLKSITLVPALAGKGFAFLLSPKKVTAPDRMHTSGANTKR